MFNGYLSFSAKGWPAMNKKPHIFIKQEQDIVGARLMARHYTKTLGFKSVDQVRIMKTITELAQNIYLYTDQGYICLGLVECDHKKGIKVIAQDTGPGISNVSDVLEDGYTTSGRLGSGLPGIKRLMDDFDIYSHPHSGTMIKTIKWVN